MHWLMWAFWNFSLGAVKGNVQNLLNKTVVVSWKVIFLILARFLHSKLQSFTIAKAPFDPASHCCLCSTLWGGPGHSWWMVGPWDTKLVSWWTSHSEKEELPLLNLSALAIGKIGLTDPSQQTLCCPLASAPGSPGQPSSCGFLCINRLQLCLPRKTVCTGISCCCVLIFRAFNLTTADSAFSTRFLMRL